jgi:glycosyltransferase involved in cell wall biosynthesis
MNNLQEPCFVSVVIPVFNEAESLWPLVDRLPPVLKAMRSHQIIFVDDGSTDGSGDILDKIQASSPSIIEVIHFRKNCGKATALQAGFDKSTGTYIVMLDADLQDQPEEIPKLIEMLERHKLDAVTGWKVNRQDPFYKTIPSRYFNLAVRWFSGLYIHDFNCGLKAFRRECLAGLILYGQMHRFLLIFIARFGFKVGEVPVRHEPRRYGHSKYGTNRIFHGCMDVFTVFFITRYLQTPLYFFGYYALWTMSLSFLTGGFFSIMHILALLNLANPHWRFSTHYLWLIAPVLFLIGLMFIFFGLIGELITYHLASRSDYRLFVRKPDQRGGDVDLRGNRPA